MNEIDRIIRTMAYEIYEHDDHGEISNWTRAETVYKRRVAKYLESIKNGTYIHVPKNYDVLKNGYRLRPDEWEYLKNDLPFPTI